MLMVVVEVVVVLVVLVVLAVVRNIAKIERGMQRFAEKRKHQNNSQQKRSHAFLVEKKKTRF